MLAMIAKLILRSVKFPWMLCGIFEIVVTSSKHFVGEVSDIYKRTNGGGDKLKGSLYKSDKYLHYKGRYNVDLC